MKGARMMPHLRAAFTGERKNVPLARNAIASFAKICGFTTDEVWEIRLAAGEALSNAVEHGHANRSSGFSVRCSFEHEQLTIEIRDNGDGFRPPSPSDAPNEAPENRVRGFGIMLMRRLMDGVQFVDNGTCVRLIRRHVS
jgi:serine/threonine-protein kinase RsbW